LLLLLKEGEQLIDYGVKTGDLGPCQKQFMTEQSGAIRCSEQYSHVMYQRFGF